MAQHSPSATPPFSITALAFLLLVSIPPAVCATLSNSPVETIYSADQPINTITYTANPTPSGNTILRPSSGETITAGSPYTITWTDIIGSEVQLNLEDKVGNAELFGQLCDGWLINEYCGKLNNETQNTGSWVWDVPMQMDYWNAYLKEVPQTFWLELYVVTVEDSVWHVGEPFQDSGNFSIVNPGWGSSSTISSSSAAGTISFVSPESSKSTSATTTTAGLITSSEGTTSTRTQGQVTPTSSAGAASFDIAPATWPILISMAVTLLCQ